MGGDFVQRFIRAVRKAWMHLQGDLVGARWPWPGTPPTVPFPRRPGDLGRWNPEPTSLQRWMVRHRIRLRVCAVTLLVLAISWTVYLVATVGFGVAVFATVAGIAFPVQVLLAGRDVTRYVENYDNTPHQRPDPV